MNIQLLGIDFQEDFMDSPGSALPVTGANADARRVAKLIDRVGHKISGISLTADSHQWIDIAHPGFWRNQKGEQPTPLQTIITPDDIKSEIWLPRKPNARPKELGGKITLKEYVLSYTEALAKKGPDFPLIIWPVHCVICTQGYAFQPDLLASLKRWCEKFFATINIVAKGTSTYTEHYGALMAEVPLANDSSTSLRTDILDMLAAADEVWLVGEALSHCVRRTIDQIADNIGDKHLSKFRILTDCMSPVIHPAIDFPAISKAWLQTMEKRGMVLTTSDKLLV